MMSNFVGMAGASATGQMKTEGMVEE